MQPAIFFDRDGVLNQDTHYPHKPADIVWIAGAMEAVRLANEAGYLVFVVTNQAGVARGFYSEKDVEALHDWMQGEFKKQGGRIEAFAYCPHHPAPQDATQGAVLRNEKGQGALRSLGEAGLERYAIDCACRKPKPGMILGLLKRFPVDAAQSLFIGDKDIDMQAAKAAGIKGVLFSGGNLAEFLRPHLKSPLKQHG